MEYADSTAEELREEVALLQKQIAALKDSNAALEQLLTERSAALERANRELLERSAEEIRLGTVARINQERYRTLIDNIPGVVYRCSNDAAWTMEFISPQIEELTGYPASDYLKNAVRTYASVIHPDDVFHVFNAVQRGLERKQAYVIEYRIRHANGSIRWVHEKGRGVFSHEGQFLWLDGVIFDVTEKHLSLSGSLDDRGG